MDKVIKGKNKFIYYINIRKEIKNPKGKTINPNGWFNFGDRVDIDTKFKEWCEKEGVQYCVNSFLAWIQVNKGVIHG